MEEDTEKTPLKERPNPKCYDSFVNNLQFTLGKSKKKSCIQGMLYSFYANLHILLLIMSTLIHTCTLATLYWKANIVGFIINIVGPCIIVLAYGIVKLQTHTKGIINREEEKQTKLLEGLKKMEKDVEGSHVYYKTLSHLIDIDRTYYNITNKPSNSENVQQQ